jgi:hypothetical protein
MFPPRYFPPSHSLLSFCISLASDNSLATFSARVRLTQCCLWHVSKLLLTLRKIHGSTLLPSGVAYCANSVFDIGQSFAKFNDLLFITYCYPRLFHFDVFHKLSLMASGRYAISQKLNPPLPPTGSYHSGNLELRRVPKCEDWSAGWFWSIKQRQLWLVFWK